MKEKQYFADQESRWHKGLISSAISLRNQDWSPNCSRQDFTSTGLLVRCLGDRELKLRAKDFRENTDRSHSIHLNYEKSMRYISHLIDSFVKEHVGIRAYYLCLLDLCYSSIIELVPLLADEMFAVCLVMAVFCCPRMKANSVQVIFKVSFPFFFVLYPLIYFKPFYGIFNHSLNLSIIGLEAF